ncbi:uncharacterized protein LOC129589418 [Paramacrobiotus metropolitanus]|uniref:uncharacterized protein LOC129589418 n=1 Tax=Paramacrobiotus metropolitanus TaxID=2943436 RepID=UPI002445E749|nr:uncharacterized protein LOC129589418 [Paramacrobiotus metropolitanus]
MFKKDIWRFGAVDVQDDSGLVRHGVVRAVDAKQGITVDFDCPGHRADLTPFTAFVNGRLSQLSPYIYIVPGDEVQVLFRKSSDQPWCWHPAIFVSDVGVNAFALVEIRLTEANTVREVVALERVQRLGAMRPCKWRPASATFPYQRHCAQLPQDFLATANMETFLELWRQHTKTLGATVDKNRLSYLAQRGKQLTPWQCADAFRCITDLMHKRGIKRSCDDEAETNTSQQLVLRNLDSSDEVHNLDLFMCYMPVEILLEILTYLRVADQVKLRRVCSTWDIILKSILVSSVVIDRDVHGPETLIPILYKVVTDNTKTLVFVGTDKLARLALLEQPFRIMIDLLVANKVKVPLIIVAGFYILSGIWAFSRECTRGNLLHSGSMSVQNWC